jgi:hypothetical protein
VVCHVTTVSCVLWYGLASVCTILCWNDHRWEVARSQLAAIVSWYICRSGKFTFGPCLRPGVIIGLLYFRQVLLSLGLCIAGHLATAASTAASGIRLSLFSVSLILQGVDKERSSNGSRHALISKLGTSTYQALVFIIDSNNDNSNIYTFPVRRLGVILDKR